MHICEWFHRVSDNVIEGLFPTCYDNKHKMLKENICQWCFEEPALEGKTVCQACVDSFIEQQEEYPSFDLDDFLEETEDEN